MKREIINAQIIDTLDAIVEQTQIIHEHKGRIPQIEIDIVKKTISNLYEAYHLLDKLNQDIEPISKAAKTTTKSPEVIEKPKTEEKNIDKKVTDDQVVEVPKTQLEPIIIEPQIEAPIEPTPIIDVPEIEIEAPIEIIEETTESAVQSSPEVLVAPIIEKKQEPQKPIINPHAETVADRFKNDKKTLNELVENSDDKSIVSKMQKAPINDLVKAIGLNERFLFIKELFKNDGDQYSISIKALNEMDSLMHAFDYLDELKTKLDWDENSSACLKIYDLIRRKYQPKT